MWDIFTASQVQKYNLKSVCELLRMSVDYKLKKEKFI